VRVAPFVLAAALLLVAPGSASADVIFDPADADELAAVLTEATQTQNVCYGWHVTVNDVGAVSESTGSNYGAGQRVMTDTCQTTVEFVADITYTSESSESEDSATHYIMSSSDRPTTADLNALGIDFDELTGENPDVVIAKAVTALPLLAADAGLAQPIEAAPETGTAPADAQLTDDPGSDWWRGNGTMLLWAGILMAAGALFAWWVLRANRKRRLVGKRSRNKQEVRQPLSPYVPEEPTDPAPEVREEPPTEEIPAQEKPAAPAASPSSPDESTVDESGAPEPGGPNPEQARPAPPDQKDKE
jgi:hypothetical protein